VKYFDWSDEKNEWLAKERGVTFELCLVALEQGDLLAVVPNAHPRTHQKKLIVKIEDYAYVVPYVEDEEKYFLKTMYPSRRETDKYLRDKM
jgi:hypothetical protein